MTLREQMAQVIYESDWNDEPWAKCDPTERLEYLANADAVLVVFAERERLLRERIEALTAPYSANDIDSGHRRSREHYERAVRDVLGVFDDES